MAKTTDPKKIEKLNLIKGVLEGYGTSTVRRAVLIEGAASVGLIEKDTYPVMREWTKDSNRGFYVVAAMLREIETKLTGKILTKAVKRKTEKSEDATDWVIPYTDKDISEELSLMGTTISSM